MIGLAHSRRFLADGKMGRTPVVIFNAVIGALFLNLIQHGFKFADRDHVPVHAHQVLAAVFVGLCGRVRYIGVDRDFRTVQHRATPHFRRIDRNGFGHRLLF